MTDEEIVKETMKRYPEGTIVDSLGGSINEIVKYSKGGLYWQHDNFLRANDNCALFDKRGNQWAKIKEKPITNNYEIY